ncbi:hypothetical protein BC832DRAFT_566839 [Gaertneriomyces semiglobifer]|nr:hypothetical protein BC832DRAFT_566839 [Gaertneriomyces semiglobifer]
MSSVEADAPPSPAPEGAAESTTESATTSSTIPTSNPAKRIKLTLQPAPSASSTPPTAASLSLYNYPLPFKIPHQAPPLKKLRSLKPASNPHRTTYWDIQAPPSLLPQKKYCDLTGLPTHYTDPKTGLRYFDKDCFAVVRGLKERDVVMLKAVRGVGSVV